MLSDFKRCQSEIEQSISNCLKHNRSMKKKIGFLTFILFVVLSSIACVKSQEVFRFMHQEFSYDNQICITFRIPAAQSYSIVSEKFGAHDRDEKPYLNRMSKAEMTKLLKKLSLMPQLRWESMTARPSYPSNHIYILIFGPNGHLYMCSLGYGNEACSLLEEIIETIDINIKDKIGQAIEIYLQSDSK